jgi:CheY-like chemotaxis protein
VVFRLPGSATDMPELPPGVRNYLVKPVRREDLVSAIQDLAVEVRSLMVVDDDPAMARFVALSLAACRQGTPATNSDIRLISAVTGREVLDRLGSPAGHSNGAGRPDAVLLDLGLPDMSGWDVLAALQESPDWRHIPVILVTAANLYDEMDSRERKSLQVSTCRPLAAGELGAALRALLQAIRPTFPAGGDVPERPTDPSA